MKVAICNETYRGWTLENAFRHAHETGYDGIEIAPFTLQTHAFDISEAQISEVTELAARYQLEVVGLHWLLAFTTGLHVTSPDKSIRQRTAAYLSQLAQVCSKLGGRVLVLGSPQQRNTAAGISPTTADELAIDCLNRVLPALRQHKVVLALEPLGPEEGNFLLTAEWGRRLVRAMNSPFVRLHLDVKAMCSESLAIPEIIRDSKTELVHFHANDPNRRGPGMGEVDYQPILQALRAIDYRGWLSVEVFDESVPPEVTAVESLQYLRERLAD